MRSIMNVKEAAWATRDCWRSDSHVGSGIFVDAFCAGPRRTRRTGRRPVCRHARMESEPSQCCRSRQVGARASDLGASFPSSIPSRRGGAGGDEAWNPTILTESASRKVDAKILSYPHPCAEDVGNGAPRICGGGGGRPVDSAVVLAALVVGPAVLAEGQGSGRPPGGPGGRPGGFGGPGGFKMPAPHDYNPLNPSTIPSPRCVNDPRRARML